MDISDGDSSNDSDYNSDDAFRDQDEAVPEAVVTSERALVGISSRRRREISDVWEVLRDGDAAATARQVATALLHNNSGLWTTILGTTAWAKKGPASSATGGGARSIAGVDPMLQHVKRAEVTAAQAAAVVALSTSVPAAAPAPAPAPAPALAPAARKTEGKGVPVKTAGHGASSSSRRTLRALERTFGKSAAQRIVLRARAGERSNPWDASPDADVSASAGAKAKPAAAKAKAKAKALAKKEEKEEKAAATAASIAAAVAAALKKVARKTVVTETRRFAGRTVHVETTAMQVKSQFAHDDSDSDEKKKQGEGHAGASGAGAGSSSGGSNGGGDGGDNDGGGEGGLDSVLSTIKGPKAITTVTKSAFDWQSHKAKEGLEDDLQQASKGGGYLGRSDFLQRVDVRTYEKERDERMMQRASGKKK